MSAYRRDGWRGHCTRDSTRLLLAIASAALFSLQTVGNAFAVTEGGASALAGEHTAVQLTFEVTVPAHTPSSAVVAVAGNFQGWNYDDSRMRLIREGSIHTVTIDVLPGEIVEFLFHRGGENEVEVRPDRSPMSPRRIRVDESRTLRLSVAEWADTPPPARTIHGDVSEFSREDLLAGRRVWVYLPPGYHDTDRLYPLLVMLDGQNVFDSTTSFAGEWEVDETCERLIAAGRIEPLIVVAVDNGSGRRTAEYTPWPDPRFEGGEGAAHLAAIADQLLPWVRSNYRVDATSKRTGLAGSSLGGLMTLFALLERPDVFGRFGALSPSLWWCDERMVEELRERAPRPGERLWMDMGTAESGRMQDRDGNGADDTVDQLRRAASALRGSGWDGGSLRVMEDEGARHHESAWSKRFGTVLEFLFPPQS